MPTADSTEQPPRCRPEIMFDGWYRHRAHAEQVLEFVTTLDGTTAYGLVESAAGKWGLLYESDRVWFPNHRARAER